MMTRVPTLPLALLLAACSGPEAAPGSAATDLISTAPQTAPQSSWAVTAEGIGALRAGMTTREASAALGAPLPAVTSAECEMMPLPGAPGEAYLMVVADTVVRFDVRDSRFATAAGARVGDSEARIEGLYPGGVRVQPHKYTSGRYLVVPAPGDTTRRLVFETDSARTVTTFRSGRIPEVEWVEGCS
jgi:hypothetical protein